MWRPIFLALGAGLLMLGIESLALDHAVVAPDSMLGKRFHEERVEVVRDEYGFEVGTKKVKVPVTKTVSPPEWAPWSMMSSGAVILLYSLALRYGGGGGGGGGGSDDE